MHEEAPSFDGKGAPKTGTAHPRRCDGKGAHSLSIPTVTNATERAVLRAIVEEPGERTAAQLAAELGLDKRAVGRAAGRLGERGLVARRLYRTHAHATLGPFESPMQRRIVRLCRDVYLTKKQLAVALGVDAKAGAFSRALRQLHAWGSLSTPLELWPSPLGVQVASTFPPDTGDTDG